MFLFRWLWKNMKGCRAIYITALCLTVVCQSMYIITPYFTQQITDTFIINENALQNIAEHTDVLIYMLAAMIIFTLVRCAIQYGSNMMYEHSSQTLIYRVRKVLFDKIENQDASFYNVYRTGDIMTRVTSDLDMVRHSVAWIIKTMVECVVLFSASLIYFFTMDWLMALCLIALTPVILFITWLFKRKAGPLYVDLREKLSRMNTAAEENISGNRVVKAFAREDYEIKQFDKYSQEYNKANKKASFMWLKFFPFLEVTAQSLSVVMLVCGGLFVVFGRITMGQYAAFAGLIWTLSNPMRTLGNIVNDLQRFSASANKIIEIYYGSPKIVDRNDAVDKPERFKGSVEFDHVSFSYGNTEVLKDITFSVEPGETVVIMGETGSGKTTLAELIPRIYDVKSGEVRVDGVSVNHLKLKQLRSNIGFATQDVLLYSDTIDGNISFGDSDMPEEDVVKYAKAADADGFVRKLSDGYNTIVGERGVGLSGGQKQRISLARALAVKPAILILDDTTSAVDLETEKHIQQSLSNLDFPCTKIIIAQRISTAKYADKIIVLKDGRILEQGTHDELIQSNGYYREVYDLQK
ncbi:MAG: ABC transporter ATP-binding protein [Oscillospiraceae bacterium]|nr:ABC transporter ATP-binding protein [Oscillospiraceae bacterium]